MSGDPGLEYAAAREGAALLLLPDRAVIAVTGPLRQKFLHNLLSNAVEGRKPGEGCQAALMDVKGHLLALLRVQVTSDAVVLEVPADSAERIEALLVHYRVAAPVRFARPAVTVLALLGPQANAVLERAGFAVSTPAASSTPAAPPTPAASFPLAVSPAASPAASPTPAAFPALATDAHVDGTLAGVTVRVGRGGDLPAGGLVLHVPLEAMAAVQAALVDAGAHPIGRDTFDTLRIEDGRPWYGLDVTEENLLHETGLVGQYHSPTKGCYVGQEVIARLEARGGNVNKRLRGLTLSARAVRGAAVSAGDKDIGRVTSAAVSPRLGPIALAYVHRNQAEPGTAVSVDGRTATVVEVPFPNP